MKTHDRDHNHNRDHNDDHDDSKEHKYHRRGHIASGGYYPVVPRWKAHVIFCLVSLFLLYVANEQQLQRRRPLDGEPPSGGFRYDNVWNPDYPICYRPNDKHTVTLKEIEPVLTGYSFLVKRYERMKWDFLFDLQRRRSPSLNQTRSGRIANCKETPYLVLIRASAKTGIHAEGGNPRGDNNILRADLVYSMFHLGYTNITITSTLDETVDLNVYDRIFTDVDGYYQGRRYLAIPHVHCRVRILTMYGVDRDQRYRFGDLFDPRHYWTSIPGHSPENSFLGFAVPSYRRPFDAASLNFSSSSTPTGPSIFPKKWSGFVLADDADQLALHCGHLRALAQNHQLKLHSAVKDSGSLHENFIVNHHGSRLSSAELMKDLFLFIGIGDPTITGFSSALEAISRGMVVLNLGYDSPGRRLDHAQQQQQQQQPQTQQQQPPTQQYWTSRFPYLERLPGSHVITVNPNNGTNMALQMAKLRRRFEEVHAGDEVDKREAYRRSRHVVWLAETEHNSLGYVPDDYTSHGLMERVDRLLKSKDSACKF